MYLRKVSSGFLFYGFFQNPPFPHRGTFALMGMVRPITLKGHTMLQAIKSNPERLVFWSCVIIGFLTQAALHAFG